MYEIESIEAVFSLFNAIFGILAALYVSKVLRKQRKHGDSRLMRYVKSTLIAVIFLSGFSIAHSMRETFNLKVRYGLIVEIPEYIFIFLVFVVLILQLVFYDAPNAND